MKTVYINLQFEGLTDALLGDFKEVSEDNLRIPVTAANVRLLVRRSKDMTSLERVIFLLPLIFLGRFKIHFLLKN